MAGWLIKTSYSEEHFTPACLGYMEYMVVGGLETNLLQLTVDGPSKDMRSANIPCLDKYLPETRSSLDAKWHIAWADTRRPNDKLRAMYLPSWFMKGMIPVPGDRFQSCTITFDAKRIGLMLVTDNPEAEQVDRDVAGSDSSVSDSILGDEEEIHETSDLGSNGSQSPTAGGR